MYRNYNKHMSPKVNVFKDSRLLRIANAGLLKCPKVPCIELYNLLPTLNLNIITD